jgi:asparagine synthase (glutamine-hydrolysing)
MCGIAGIIRKNKNSEPIDIKSLEEMSRLIEHRGPDSNGIHIDQNKRFGLAHRRLSILDLSSSGDQPMRCPSGNWIVYNGELYNYKEIASRLGLEELEFKSDTQVILAAYARWGKDCVREFRGMFAFVIWDEKEQYFFCARDHFGIKPFYYYESNNSVYFASEPKAILPFLRNKSINRKALKDYLVFQLYLSSKTLFEGIIELPPAHIMIIKNGSLTIERYWNLEFKVGESRNSKYYEEKIQDLLEKSVKRHLIGDVPIGAYVSGGLDSSSIAAIAKMNLPESEFLGFTGKFSKYGKSFDESRYAQLVADQNNFKLLSYDITSSDFIEHIQDVIYHLDSPVAGPGSFSQFMISKFASKYRKVVLGGQGGDEIFGGYTRYLVAYFEQCIKAAINGTSKNGNFVVTYESIIPNLIQLKQYQPMLKSFWKEGLFEDMYERYFRLVNRAPSLGDEINWDFMNDYSAKDEYKKVFYGNKINEGSYFDLMTNYDFRTLLPALLQVEDRMSMAHGLESRVPLLDVELVEFSSTIPADIKFKNGNPKHVFKNALEKYLPREIIRRQDKMGFPTPINQWFKDDLRTFVLDTFNSSNAKQRDYINGNKIVDQIDKEGLYGRKVWGLLSLELWHQKFQIN